VFRVVRRGGIDDTLDTAGDLPNLVIEVSPHGWKAITSSLVPGTAIVGVDLAVVSLNWYEMGVLVRLLLLLLLMLLLLLPLLLKLPL
jgi:hypothetical protein